MFQIWKTDSRRLQQSLVLGMAGILAPLCLDAVTGGGDRAIAQIVPDATLGTEQSVVAPAANIRGLPGILIRGGARRGGNLFQSFADFNVGSGQRVYFANPAGVETILSRVTGRNPSNILGTLGVDGLANLFLINPNGILFGPNARLDVAGSFVASTADRLDFGNGQSFSATDPQAPPLLAISLQPGLQYGTNYQGDITNAGNLTVGAGKTLALAGRTVTSTGLLATPGGTVQVLGDRVSLLQNARVDVSSTSGGGTVLIGGDFQGQGPLPTASETLIGPNVTINANGISSLRPTPDPQPPAANGGRVIVWADGTTRFFGTITARGGALAGDGGFVEVSGRENLVFQGLVDASAPNGRPGTLLLDPTNIEIVAGPGNGTLADVFDPNLPNRGTDGTQISAALLNASPQTVILQATNNITFSAPISFTTPGVGLTALAGNSIFVNSDIRTDGGGSVAFRAQSGDVVMNGITIDTNRTFAGIAGNVDISAGKQVILNGVTIDARSDTASNNFATIKINGENVSINQSYITATNIGSGFAGDIAITAQNRVDILNSRGPIERGTAGAILAQPPGIFSQGNFGRILIGQSEYFPFSPLFVRIDNAQLVTNNQASSGTGAIRAGDISIKALRGISLTNRSYVSSVSNREGNSGRVFIETPGLVALSGQSFISTDVSPAGQGNARGVRIDAGRLTMNGQSAISTSTFSPNSNAGIVLLLVSRDIILDGGSTIFNNLESGAINGVAGNIGIRADNLTLLNGSQIQTIVRGIDLKQGLPAATGQAGNIFVEVEGTVKAIGFTANSHGIFPSAIFSSVGEGSGNSNAGFVSVEARSIQLRNRGSINVDNLADGTAGDILIRANGLWLDNLGNIVAQSRSGQGGNVLLGVNALVLGRNGNVSTSSGTDGSPGAGGNIAIGNGRFSVIPVLRRDGVFVPAFQFERSTLLLAGKTFNDNNVLAQAFTGSGGNIRINAFRIIDLRERPDLAIRNDIDTRSFLGVDGTTVVSAIDVFPSFRADPLPEKYTPPRISQGCDPRVRRETSQFTITGRGGLPADPTEILSPDTLAGSETTPTSTGPAPDVSAQVAIAPARGWVKQADGSVRLVAHATDSKAPIPNLTFPNLTFSNLGSCNAP